MGVELASRRDETADDHGTGQGPFPGREAGRDQDGVTVFLKDDLLDRMGELELP